jgi:SAM-dependent methyltransferase
MKAWEATLIKAVFGDRHMGKFNKAINNEMSEVMKNISPNDKMFSGDLRHYFSVGESALECIKLSLLAARKPTSTVKRVLDIPCGHGRVLRYLKSAFPNAEITACDLDKDAVKYCASTFGSIPSYSKKDPKSIKINGPFDLIWCGSLLTHLDQNYSKDFIRLFDSLLSDNGVLLMTFHGPSCVQAVHEGSISYNLDQDGKKDLQQIFPQSGYYYKNYSDIKNYGISFVAPFWVTRQLFQMPDLRLLLYLEMGWDNHQDVVSCIREPFSVRTERVLRDKE